MLGLGFGQDPLRFFDSDEFEDAQGALWIGHETGSLTKLEHGKFTDVQLPSVWPGGPVLGIGTDKDGVLWLLNYCHYCFLLQILSLSTRDRVGKMLNKERNRHGGDAKHKREQKRKSLITR